jgi:IS30 family transposase
VSHETIHRSLYIHARRALKRELLEHLRRSRVMRRSRHHTLKTEDRTNIRDAVSISERPPAAEDRAIPGMLVKVASKLPRELYKSLTWDRGSEMADHNRFTVATNIKVYFGDPQHPWQRGSNQNANGLLRQYFPKGTDLSVYSQTRLDVVARRLNERPRETLNFDTPAERFHQTVASTG